MGEEIPRVDDPKTHENKSPDNGGGTKGQPSQDTELTPDRPPVPAYPYDATSPKRSRGFAAMDQKLLIEIARKGGKAAHSAGTAHEFTREEARIAGRKGGRAAHEKQRRAIEEQGKPDPPDGKQRSE